MALADMLAERAGIPWCFVNPSYYFGDQTTGTWKDDWYDIVQDLARYYFLPLVEQADIVLHATDAEFDGLRQLPPNHDYVGFLLWETTGKLPDYLQQPGDPWALDYRPRSEEILGC